MIPEKFLNRMKETLGDEYDDFYKSFDKPRFHALRINTLKATSDELSEVVLSTISEDGKPLRKVNWNKNGYYYSEDKTPGKHPYHAAGAYYIQEPSAMLPGEMIDAKPGEIILDLCAAPGGKSTQIAAHMKGEGILVSNEINSARAKILSENIERMGIKNAIVLNETPASLSERFQGCFDKIMVDAPCSGEGMFRKTDIACEEWSEENVSMCAIRQRQILECADIMLKEGGIICYSTCTVAKEENEDNILAFMKDHPEYKLLEERRIWPHKDDGEGHFCAVIKKGNENKSVGQTFWKTQKSCDKKLITDFINFDKEYIIKDSFDTEGGIYVKFGDNLYLAPNDTFDLTGLKVLRAGLWLGTLKKERFEPSHSLALALKPCDFKNNANFDADSNEVKEYLKGNVIDYDEKNGWILICVNGFSLGFGKLSNNVIKNHYPKGLRN